MNKRIRELAMQTDRECEHLGQSDIGEDWVEKFAELIVQECIGLFNYDPTGAMSSMAESIHNDIAVKRIQEHFGVK